MKLSETGKTFESHCLQLKTILVENGFDSIFEQENFYPHAQCICSQT